VKGEKGKSCLEPSELVSKEEERKGRGFKGTLLKERGRSTLRNASLTEKSLKGGGQDRRMLTPKGPLRFINNTGASKIPEETVQGGRETHGTSAGKKIFDFGVAKKPRNFESRIGAIKRFGSEAHEKRWVPISRDSASRDVSQGFRREGQ